MSYCRFSSDDHQCDVYVYADCSGGFTTHIAGRRPVFSKPLPPKVDMDNTAEWLARDNIVSQMLADSEYVDIGLPHDGAMYNDASSKECAERLIYLRKIGYNVPQYAIDALMEEEND